MRMKWKGHFFEGLKWIDRFLTNGRMLFDKNLENNSGIHMDRECLRRSAELCMEKLGKREEMWRWIC